MSEHRIRDFALEHKKAEVAAGASAVAAAAILASLMVRGRRHREDNTISQEEAVIADYRKSLEVFRDERISEKIRSHMPEVAARIYLSTSNNAADTVILFGKLRELHSTEINKDDMSKVLGFMGDRHVIGKRQSTLTPIHKGYYVEAALKWAIDIAGEEELPEVHDAINRIVGGAADDNPYSFEPDSEDYEVTGA